MLIAQVTDIHLGFEPDNPSEFNRKRLDQVLGRLASMTPQPDMLLATGDLVDRGDIRSYERLRGAIEACAFPVYPCLGNHDNRAHFFSVFTEFTPADGFAQYAVDAGGRRLVVLDTLEEGRHGGAFCDVRAAWLSRTLAEAPKVPTLIVMHHPPVETGVPWMNTDPAEPWVARFAEAIAGHAQITGIVCGHVHRAITCRWNGVTVSVCPSSAPQVALDLAPIDPDAPDGRPMIIADPPGFALHRWHNGEMVSLFETADDHLVLARYDAKMQPLVRSLLGERPGAV